MTETTQSDTPAAPASAGARLRAARERRGLHIAALAASMKVPQRKLEALEGDRYDELPDVTFTRALAQSVCRALKIDAQPILDLLPGAPDPARLAQVGAGLNTPFRERPGRDEPGDWGWVRKPLFWVTLLVLGAAIVLASLPQRWLSAGSSDAGPAAPAASSATPASSPSTGSGAVPALQDAAASAAVAVPVAAAASVVDAAGQPLLSARASAPSWIEVQDARGQLLLSRHVMAGETVRLEGVPPLRIVVGNASSTQLEYRGQGVDLTPHARDNVARLQLD
ncbi:MAG TPA: RodZ domain-containing protein [Burkholderiaceae bacterium]|nr:RodZ domain-containing protein [Burkholderiaceae bacterium]